MDIQTKNRFGQELLQEIKDQLNKWADDSDTSGYQHEPMRNLARKISNHLEATKYIDEFDKPKESNHA